MKIVVNDHSGHAFPLQLSRQFAAGGHDVLHAYSASFQSPKGDFEKAGGVDGLTVMPIRIKGTFQKYSLLKRRQQEIAYARQLTRQMASFRPAVVLSGTTPLFVQQYVQAYCQRHQIRFIYWCQDIYTIAIRQIALKKIGYLGFPIWQYFRQLESSVLRRSDHIISITHDFNDIFQRWKIDTGRQVTCIPNWAPVNAIQRTGKQNAWAAAHGLEDKTCVIYSGTLGLKHNPALLSAAAQYFRSRNDVRIIVISEGLGADYLREEKERLQLNNLLLLPFQDFSDMGAVLGTADILLAILEKDAGIYSVPSKVLTYLCAERPIVLAMPPENLSAAIVQRNGAGLCVPPDNTEGFCQHIAQLVDNPALRQEMGSNGRKYAEQQFDINRIGAHFMDVFERTLSNT